MHKSAIFGVMCGLFMATAAVSEEIRVNGLSEKVNLESENFSLHKTFEDTRYISELHYDAENQYLVYKQKSTYYQRCGVSQVVVDAWLSADSIDSYYKSHILKHYKCCDENMPDCSYE